MAATPLVRLGDVEQLERFVWELDGDFVAAVLFEQLLQLERVVIEAAPAGVCDRQLRAAVGARPGARVAVRREPEVGGERFGGVGVAEVA